MDACPPPRNIREGDSGGGMEEEWKKGDWSDALELLFVTVAGDFIMESAEFMDLRIIGEGIDRPEVGRPGEAGTGRFCESNMLFANESNPFDSTTGIW